MRIQVIQGNIVHQEVDAIINAANTSLLGGGGVDGAIHCAAGPDLLDECRLLHGCKTGDAKITKGYQLPAAYVIHTVGPVWNGGTMNEESLLASCYRRCYEIAGQHNLQSLAFPAISTGVYRFPLDLATRIARAQTERIAEMDSGIECVRFVCFNREAYDCYVNIFGDFLVSSSIFRAGKRI